MRNENKLDVKIATFLKKCFNYYIKKRTYSKPSKTEDEIWNEIFIENKNVILNLQNNIKLILYKDSELCKLIYFGFEENELAFLRRFLKPGDSFIDIGANIGLFTLVASEILKDNGKIYAFEPAPKTYNRLLENIKLNDISQARTYNIGLSKSRDTLSFHVSNSGFDAWNSFAKSNKLEDATVIEVKVDTLDQIIIKENIQNPTLIKIDVEGWEKFVIQGANSLLNKNEAPVLMVEFTETNAFAAGYYCGELFDLVKEFGYEWYSYDLKSNILRKEVKKLHYEWENLIAIKEYSKCLNRLNN